MAEHQASDGSECELLDNDPLEMQEDATLEAGDSVTFRAQISVQGTGDDWGFTAATLVF